MWKLFFLSVMIASQQNVLAVEPTPAKTQVDCSDETKTKLLIKKGAVDKEFCLRVKDNNIKLLITGKLYKLASYSNSTTNNSNALKCGSATNVQDNKTPPPTDIKIPEDKISVFEKVVTGLISKIKAFNKTKGEGEQLSDKIKVKGTGYADGMRVFLNDFDTMIYDNLGAPKPGFEYKVLKQYTDGRTTYPISKEEFKAAVCGPKVKNSNRGDSNAVIPNDYPKIINPTRNTYLAATRAEYLLNLVTKNFPKEIMSAPEIVANSSPLMTTGQNLCKGFCTYRRGADLQMEVPGLQSLETAGPKETKKIPSTIVSLQSAHYPEFVPLSFVTYIKDIENFLNTDTGEPTKKYKEFLKKIKVFPSTTFKIKITSKGDETDKIKLDEYYTYDGSEREDVNDRHTLKKTFNQNAGQSLSLDQVRSTESEFFKHFIIKRQNVTLDDKNPYLVWARVHFWAIVGTFDFKDDKITLGLSQVYKEYDSQKEVQVSAPQPSLLKLVIKNLIKNCPTVYAHSKISTMSNGEIRAAESEISQIEQESLLKESSKNQTSFEAALADYITNVKTKPFYTGLEPDEKPNFVKYLKGKYSCTVLSNSIEEFSQVGDRVVMKVDTIFDTATSFSASENKDDLAKYISGVIFQERLSQFDQLVASTKDQSAQLTSTTNENPGSVAATVIRNEIYALKKHNTFGLEFKGTGLNEDRLLVATSSETYKPEKSVVLRSTKGKTTSVFNFLDFRASTLWALRNFPSIYTEKVVRPIKENEQIEAIFVNVDKITTAATNGDYKVKGFFHSACKTGMVFDMKPENDKFRYLSRLRVDPDYDPRTDEEVASYDRSYDLVTDKTPPMTLMKIKHPTTYIIPKCNGCGCLKELLLTDEKLNKNIDYPNKFRDLLAGAIPLDFSRGYKWMEDPNASKAEKDALAKKYKGTIPKIPYLEYSAKDILKRYKDKYPTEKPASEEYLTSEFCVFSPIVPQPHEIGVGETDPDKDHNNNMAEVPTTTTCPLVDLLNEKIQGKETFPDVITDPAMIDEIYNHCNNITDKLGMPEETCKNDPEQLCHALSPQDKVLYQKECTQLSMQVGDSGNVSRDKAFCEKLME